MRVIKLSSKNKDKVIKVAGNEHKIDKILVSKEHVRVKKGPSIFEDFHFNDIQEAEELIINISNK